MNGRCESLPRAPRLLLFLCGQRSERQCFPLITTPHVRKAARQAARSASASSQAHALPLQLISLQTCNQRLSNFIFSDNLMGSKHVFTVQWAPVTQFLYLVIFFYSNLSFPVKSTVYVLFAGYPISKILIFVSSFYPCPNNFWIERIQIKGEHAGKVLSSAEPPKEGRGRRKHFGRAGVLLVQAPGTQSTRFLKATRFPAATCFFFFFCPPSLSLPPVSPHPRSKYRGSSERVNERVAKAVA